MVATALQNERKSGAGLGAIAVFQGDVMVAETRRGQRSQRHDWTVWK